MSRLRLASGSEIRRVILARAGVAFEVTKSALDEEAEKARLQPERLGPAETAARLAAAKALAAPAEPGDLVIGADQTLELDGAMLDKAPDLPAARARLQALRGRTHHLHAAVCLVRGGARVWGVVETGTLAMRAVSDAFIDRYLSRNADVALSSVGCYDLEGEGAQMFDRLDGDFLAMQGLPLIPLLGALRALGAIAP